MYGLQLYICERIASLLYAAHAHYTKPPNVWGPKRPQMFQSMREWVRRLATTLIINEYYNINGYNDDDYGTSITLFDLTLNLKSILKPT